MKVKQQQQQQLLPRGSWDFHLTSSSCSHQTLRPLAPKLDTTAPASLPPPPPPAAAHEAAGGSSSSNTRWNPTEEQIGMLEMLYSRGMRTPNSHQIENIALQLSKFGKIQPKNVFYWFQNHKARERQKLKRLSTSTTSTTTMPTSFFTFHHQTSEEKAESEEAITTITTTSKKKCTNWTFHKLETSRRLSHALSTNSLQAELEINNDDHANQVGFKKTLQLFPLHPEHTKLD